MLPLNQCTLSSISATYDQFVKFDFYEMDGVDATRRFIIIDIRNWKLDPTGLWVSYSEGQMTADPFGNRLIAKVLCNYQMSLYRVASLFHIITLYAIKSCALVLYQPGL